jgi:hypothetical protein
MIDLTYYRTKGKLLVLFGLSLITFLVISQKTIGQTAAQDWAVPTNLSRSGMATDPKIVTDATGIIHVLWRDDALGSFVYSSGTPGNWIGPISVELPFGTRQFFGDLREGDPTPLFAPHLLAGADGRIHSFWRDDEGSVWYSWVLADQMANYVQWSPRQKLVDKGADFAIAVDEDDRLHLGYIDTQSEDTLPTGIYYRRLDDVDFEWSAPISLYQSDYFEQLPTDQANIQLAVTSGGESPNVYVAWENRSLEKLYLARSEDGGQTWGESKVIDQRQVNDETNAIGPSDIIILANDANVLLVWQAGHGSLNCAQYYQHSTDGGDTWQSLNEIFEGFTGCPEYYQFVERTDDLPLLFTIFQNQPFLLAWDGSRWSDPQPQQALNELISPETYRTIKLGCYQFSLLDQDQLLTIGCGVGPFEQTADVWMTYRELGASEEWFPPPPTWSRPTEITAGTFEVSDPNLVVDSKGRLHAFWSQPDEENSIRTAIYYAQWEDESWMQPVRILTSPEGGAEKPEVVVTDDDRLLVIWVGGSGEFYFSQSSTDQAMFSADWSAPVALPSLQSIVSGADIVIDNKGTIYIAYVLPFNENRGIYLLFSEDGGYTWSEPTLAFDGVEAGWDVVGPPRLIVTADDRLHLLWTEGNLASVGSAKGTQALYYAKSDDRGRTFAEPKLVTEIPITWIELVGDNEQVVHRFWQEQLGAVTGLRHEYSLNDGQDWSSPSRVTDNPGPIGIAVDSNGQIHALQASEELLSHYIWEDGRWSQAEDLELTRPDSIAPSESQDLSVAFTQDQRLAALLINRIAGSEDIEPLTTLLGTLRMVDGSDSPGASSPSIQATTPIPSATSTSPTTTAQESLPTPESLLTPTATATKENTVNSQNRFDILNPNSDTSVLAIAFLPVILLLVVVFVVGIRTVRNKRH